MNPCGCVSRQGFDAGGKDSRYRQAEAENGRENGVREPWRGLTASGRPLPSSGSVAPLFLFSVSHAVGWENGPSRCSIHRIRRALDRKKREADGRARRILEGQRPGREEYFRHENAGKILLEVRSADRPGVSCSGQRKGVSKPMEGLRGAKENGFRFRIWILWVVPIRRRGEHR